MTDALLGQTPTLAGLYADQGHYGEALTLFHHMISAHPDQAAIQTAYADTVERKNRIDFENTPDFTLLFRQWLDLLIRYRYVSRNNAADS